MREIESVSPFAQAGNLHAGAADVLANVFLSTLVQDLPAIFRAQADGDLEGVIEGFRAALDRESAQAVSAVASILSVAIKQGWSPKELERGILQ